MTRTSGAHGPGRKETRARRLSIAPPSQVVAPYRDMVRHLTSSLVAMIPLVLMFADDVDLYSNWPWVAGTLTTVAAMARVMNTPRGERFIAQFMPWLAAENYEQPTPR